MALLPQPLIVLHEDETFVCRLVEATPSVLRIVKVPSWTELRRAVLLGPPGTVVVVDPYAGRLDDAPTRELGRLRRDFPTLALMAALRVSQARHPDLDRFMARGTAEVIVTSTGRDALRRQLVASRSSTFRRLLRAVLPTELSPRPRALVQDAMEVAAGRGLAEDWATGLGLSSRTLLRRCNLAGLPPPRRLLAWMRVMLAVDLLECPAHSITTAAVACGYAADMPLRRAITRLTGAAPIPLLRAGGLRVAAERFASDVAAHHRAKES